MAHNYIQLEDTHTLKTNKAIEVGDVVVNIGQSPEALYNTLSIVTKIEGPRIFTTYMGELKYLKKHLLEVVETKPGGEASRGDTVICKTRAGFLLPGAYFKVKKLNAQGLIVYPSEFPKGPVNDEYVNEFTPTHPLGKENFFVVVTKDKPKINLYL